MCNFCKKIHLFNSFFLRSYVSDFMKWRRRSTIMLNLQRPMQFHNLQHTSMISLHYSQRTFPLITKDLSIHHYIRKYTHISKAHCPLDYITWLSLLARTPLANDKKLSFFSLSFCANVQKSLFYIYKGELKSRGSVFSQFHNNIPR